MKKLLLFALLLMPPLNSQQYLMTLDSQRLWAQVPQSRRTLEIWNGSKRLGLITADRRFIPDGNDDVSPADRLKRRDETISFLVDVIESEQTPKHGNLPLNGNNPR